MCINTIYGLLAAINTSNKKIGSFTLNSRRRQIAKHHIKILFLTAFAKKKHLGNFGNDRKNSKNRKKRQTIIKSQNN